MSATNPVAHAHELSQPKAMSSPVIKGAMICATEFND